MSAFSLAASLSRVFKMHLFFTSLPFNSHEGCKKGALSVLPVFATHHRSQLKSFICSACRQAPGRFCGDLRGPGPRPQPHLPEPSLVATRPSRPERPRRGLRHCRAPASARGHRVTIILHPSHSVIITVLQHIVSGDVSEDPDPVIIIKTVSVSCLRESYSPGRRDG